MSLLGPSPKALREGRASAKREFDGTCCTGWTGGTHGNQKCPLNFFIICGYIDYIYIYLLIYEIQIVTNILMGFKI